MILKGNNLILKANGYPLAASKSCSINVKTSMLETTTTTTGSWRTFEPDRNEWSVSCSHLVTLAAWSNELLKRGTSVTLSMVARNGNVTYNFSGIVGAVAVQESRVYDPDDIYWHSTIHQFVAKKGDNYYKLWSYTNPSAPAESYFTTPDMNATYLNEANSYGYAYDPMTKDMVQLNSYSGTAIVENIDVSARRGSLTTGSFKFRGSGALSIVTPS